MTNRIITMLRLLLVLIILELCALTTVATLPESSSGVLRRKKRFVAFPDGSSVSGALCLTIGVIGNPHTDYLSYALNWGVAYDLPNETWARQYAHGFKNELQNPKPVAQRRSRRELYEKIEAVIDGMGFNGHACIARALCESSKYLQQFPRRRGNMMEEIVKSIFSLPKPSVHSHEPRSVQRYDHIFRQAPREVNDCSEKYAECHFSLLELALGKYSVPPNTKHEMWNAGRLGGLRDRFVEASSFM